MLEEFYNSLSSPSPFGDLITKNSKILSLRGSKAEGALSSNHRHCEALEKPKQSRSRLNKWDCFVARFTHSSQWRNFRILCDVIPWSSQGMTQGLGILDFALEILEFLREFTRNSRIPRQILKFLSLVSSPDLIRGSHHKEF